MPRPNLATTDPLAAFLADRATGEDRIPLVSTDIDVDIRSGVAVVTSVRVFRNVESRAIEATMTFPVPVHATLFSLEARIGGRALVATAERRDEARETYEEALEEGRTAVLHEEILKGLHMLSVGSVDPDTEVEVTLRWCSTLSLEGDIGKLRIPTTLGDVYGRPPFPESDAPVVRDWSNEADLRIRCDGGTATLIRRQPEEGRIRVRLDGPLDIVVSGMTFAPLTGRRSDGRSVRIGISAAPGAEHALDLALLIDRSGSMEEYSDEASDDTKHDRVLQGLAAFASHLRPGDTVDAWQFDTDVDWVGCAEGANPAASFRAVIAELGGPRGGTAVGAAIEHVARDGRRDLLVITDGKSYDLDVQALARTECRITVCLIGEDSLDGGIAYLAALTGGDVFIASRSDIEQTLGAALDRLRRSPAAPRSLKAGSRFTADRRGAHLEIEIGGDTDPDDDSVFARAVGALAAGLRLPLCSEDEAARIAMGEGLVTHLTSLVLVDEDGTPGESIPAMRKVPLSTPRATDGLRRRLKPTRSHCLKSFTPTGVFDLGSPQERKSRSQVPGQFSDAHRAEFPSSFLKEDGEGQSSSRIDLLPDPDDPEFLEECQLLASQVDWHRAPERLVTGDLSHLSPRLAIRLEVLAADQKIAAEAERLAMEPLLFLLGLLARSVADTDRGAARVAKRLLGRQSAFGISDI